MCAVAGVPDEKRGEGIVAVVVLDPSTPLTEGYIIARCPEFIAGYKVPKGVRFADALPMNATGKIMKNRLREELRFQTLPT